MLALQKQKGLIHYCSNNIDDKQTFCGGCAATTGSTLCVQVDWIYNRLEDGNTTYFNYQKALAEEVNATTHNIYDYMTGTLATNINSVLTTVGVINATVTRIETNTVAINDTVTTIQSNQERVVHMTTF